MLSLACGALPPLTLTGSAPAGPAGLSWLAGCWQGGSGNRVIEEQWMRQRNGVTLGAARVSGGEAVRSIEFAELRVRGDSVEYVATPIGEQRTTFRGSMTGPHAFLASNPGHDFPTSVGYELVSRDSLSAWIEGMQGSEKRRVPYTYHRVACEES